MAEIKCIGGDAMLNGLPEKGVYKVFGPAGTGKTTMASRLAEGKRAVFLAYTGKAALRMRECGCTNASTIHRVLYKFGKNYQRTYSPSFELMNAEIVVIDECSMCPADLAADLLRSNPNALFLVLGDPCQLPPIHPEDAPFYNDPDHMLTHVYRQEANSPILDYATSIREDEAIDVFVPQGIKRYDGNLEGFDVVLCGRNVTRVGLNKQLFAMHGRPEYPQLVVLANNYKYNVFNGEILPEGEQPPFPVSFGKPKKPNSIVHVDYGYALTVHKAQGSQWDNVLLFDESMYFGEYDWRWLYTGVTRAAKELTICHG